MRIEQTGLSLRTVGLAPGQREILATVELSELVPEAEHFLRYIAQYVHTTKATIQGGQTLKYGYWLIKFVESLGHLDAWELAVDGDTFVPGITSATKYWREQHRVCKNLGANFAPPDLDQLVVISEGVLEGDQDVQGVRYPSPSHMSGWWLTTSRYSGDVKSLKPVHARHVTSARPDILPLVALPCGFRFDLSNRQDIWFDEAVLASADL